MGAFDGIMGLGLDDPAMNGRQGYSFLEQLVQAGKVGSTAFALRLGNRGESQLLLGDLDSSAVSDRRVLWVPLSDWANGNWQFSVSDITLNGQPQNFLPFEVLVDSGTSLLTADDNLRSWLENNLNPS